MTLLESANVASEVFFDGSKGMKLLSAAFRIPSDAPPRSVSPHRRILTAVGARHGREDENVRFIESRQRVNVRHSEFVLRQRAGLSAHNTSMDATSSTADRRVGSTPSLPALVRQARTSVKVAGSATGMTQGSRSARENDVDDGHVQKIGVTHHQHDDDAMQAARLRTTRNTASCCELTTCATRTSSAV